MYGLSSYTLEVGPWELHTLASQREKSLYILMLVKPSSSTMYGRYFRSKFRFVTPHKGRMGAVSIRAHLLVRSDFEAVFVE